MGENAATTFATIFTNLNRFSNFFRIWDDSFKEQRWKEFLSDSDMLAHYRTSLFIPLWGYFISQLKQRFELYQKIVSNLCVIVPSKIVSVMPRPWNLSLCLSYMVMFYPKQTVWSKLLNLGTETCINAWSQKDLFVFSSGMLFFLFPKYLFSSWCSSDVVCNHCYSRKKLLYT